MGTSAIKSTLQMLSGRSDLVLAGFLGVLVTMMVLPLPTVLIDIIITFNMTMAISILMLSIYIKTPLQFSTFPTILLLITLFRLALSISSTRAILLNADAGDIITTFGDFVVGGNLVVGFVIFLIITVVQFIVITKGAERVAEVSARFSLDAMPGKQMSIDSDLRSGTITMEEAKARRAALAKESQLFGSMDGAMKFVKGDSIAGIIIILINMAGGISIGVFQMGMSASEATEVYSILTIGDGLVSQIPALFVAIAAGIIVTRVTNDKSKHLGGDIGKQFLAKPYAIIVTSTLIFLMGFVPGFPTAIFMVISIVLGGVGWSIYKTSNKGAWTNDGKELSITGDRNERLDTTFQISAPIMVELAANVKSSILPEELHKVFNIVRQSIYNDVGVPVPKIGFQLSKNIKEPNYQIFIHDIPVSKGELYPDKCFVLSDYKPLLIEKNIPYEESSIAAGDGLWIKQKDLGLLDKNEIKVLQGSHVISNHLMIIIRQHAEKFIGIQEVYTLLSKIESDYSELIKEVLKVLTLPKLSELMKLLVSEDIPIKNLRQILEVLAEKAESEPNIMPLSEFVRASLKEHISYRFSHDNVLSAMIINAELEQTIQQSLRQSPSGIFLELSAEVSSSLEEQIEKQLSQIDNSKIKPVIITTPQIRSFLRAHLVTRFNSLPVLSQQEISASVTINPLAELRLPE
jgi:type III secretion protein V